MKKLYPSFMNKLLRKNIELKLAPWWDFEIVLLFRCSGQMARHDKNYTDKCSSKYSGKLEVHLTALRNDQHCFPQRGWLKKNPCLCGNTLIGLALENYLHKDRWGINNSSTWYKWGFSICIPNFAVYVLLSKPLDKCALAGLLQ